MNTSAVYSKCLTGAAGVELRLKPPARKSRSRRPKAEGFDYALTMAGAAGVEPAHGWSQIPVPYQLGYAPSKQFRRGAPGAFQGLQSPVQG